MGSCISLLREQGSGLGWDPVPLGILPWEGHFVGVGALQQLQASFGSGWRSGEPPRAGIYPKSSFPILPQLPALPFPPCPAPLQGLAVILGGKRQIYGLFVGFGSSKIAPDPPSLPLTPIPTLIPTGAGMEWGGEEEEEGGPSLRPLPVPSPCPSLCRDLPAFFPLHGLFCDGDFPSLFPCFSPVHSLFHDQFPLFPHSSWPV